MKKQILLVLGLVSMLVLFSCGGNKNVLSTGNGDNQKKELYIYNFGDYLADEALEIFEKETGITVYQDVFEANEEVIPVIESGAKYDLVCISDYCIERMLKKGLLKELDYSKIPNISNINKEKLNMLSACDPGNKVAVPYFCGGIGIFYNKTVFDEKNWPYPKKWSDLFDERFKGEIIMQSSIRDLYTVGLKMHGFSASTKSKEEIDIVTEDFIAQKPYVQAYMCDQIKDKMLSGECLIAPITSGDVQYVYVEDGSGKYDYTFVVPEEGTCLFIDAWCMLKTAENEENAYKFIDYMCREDIARINAEYIGYETVNDKTPDDEFLQMKQVKNGYFDYSNDNNELERDVEDAMRYYTDGYNRLKAS